MLSIRLSFATKHPFYGIMYRPDKEQDPTDFEKAACALLAIAFQLMSEAFLGRLASMEKSGMSSAGGIPNVDDLEITPAGLITFTIDPKKDFPSFYLFTGIPLADDAPEEMHILWKWVKGTVDYVTDEMQEFPWSQDPFGFQKYLEDTLPPIFITFPDP